MKINILAVMTISIFFSCLRSNIFFEKKLSDKLLCDTVFNEQFRDGKIVTEFYQMSNAVPVQRAERKYYEYLFSDDMDSSPLMLSLWNDKIYVVSKSVFYSKNFREEVLLDLRAKRGDTWTVYQGGFLGNSIITLDSTTSNGMYFLSMRKNIDVDDLYHPTQITLSRENGISSFQMHMFGSPVTCKCQDSK